MAEVTPFPLFLVGDLHGEPGSHAQGKDTPHHISGTGSTTHRGGCLRQQIAATAECAEIAIMTLAHFLALGFNRLSIIFPISVTIT